MKKIITAIALILLLTGCGINKMGDRPQIYTSFYALYDFASDIAGGMANMYNMVPAGTEPHDWEPTVQDMARLSEADVLFYNGMGMESWIDKVKSSLEKSDVDFVELSEGIEKKGNDPHVWLDPQNAKQMCRAITDKLSYIDVGNSLYYEENYNACVLKLDALDKKYREAIEAVPEEKRKIVVAHEAYGYLCDAYGIEQIAVEGIGGESEPSPSRVEEIVKYIKTNNIKYIFYEELVSPKVMQTIADEAGCKLLPLNPFEGPAADGSTEDYISVMEQNLENIKIALGDE